MSDVAVRSETEVAVTLDNLEEALKDAGKNLCLATLGLRSCFTTSDASIPSFIDLRAEVAMESEAFRRQILPLSKACTENVKEFMMEFVELTYDDVMGCLDDVRATAEEHKMLIGICRDAHCVITSKFKQKQDKVANVLSECHMQAQLHEEEYKMLKKKADSQSNWAFGLAFVPIVGLIASPLLDNAAYNNTVAAQGKMEESKLAVSASVIVRDVLGTALVKYVKSMTVITQCFELLSNECAGFAKQGDKLAESNKQKFYKLMKASAKRIINAAEMYQSFTVSAATDLLALPCRDNLRDPNYVKNWLEKQKLENDGKTFMQRLKDQGVAGLDLLKQIKA